MRSNSCDLEGACDNTEHDTKDLSSSVKLITVLDLVVLKISSPEEIVRIYT
jgi:hypothetical protein